MVYRHGDVGLVEVSAGDFAKAKRRGRVIAHDGRYVLARGEATGSVHALAVATPDAMELVLDGQTLWLRLMGTGTLTHTSDHEPLTVAPRHYVQVPERELDHFADSVMRLVVD